MPLALIWMTIVVSLLSSAPAGSVELQQPERSIGYFIGDILQQKVAVNRGDNVVVSADLETGERIDEYLYRLPVVQPAEPSWIGRRLGWFRHAAAAIYDGAGPGGSVLNIRYQVINVPPVTQTISLPELSLMTGDNESIEIPAWQFTIGPLSPDAAFVHQDGATGRQGVGGSLKDGLQFLPDRSASEFFTARDRRKSLARLGALISVLVVVLLCWLLWWLYRHFRERHILPFARARRAIGALPRAHRKSDDDAWRLLHTALNDTAGKTIVVGTLPDLLQKAPWLEAHAGDIEAFYLASAARFFQQRDPATDINVESLTEALYQLEKRQAPTDLAAVASRQGAMPASSGLNRSGNARSKSLAD